MDSRGRHIKAAAGDDLKRFYRMEDEDEDEIEDGTTGTMEDADSDDDDTKTKVTAEDEESSEMSSEVDEPRLVV